MKADKSRASLSTGSVGLMMVAAVVTSLRGLPLLAKEEMTMFAYLAGSRTGLSSPERRRERGVDMQQSDQQLAIGTGHGKAPDLQRLQSTRLPSEFIMASA